MAHSTHSIVLPNMLATWKWPRRINPHYGEVKQASAAWLAGFGAFSPKAQQAFDRCDFSMWLAVELFPEHDSSMPCDARLLTTFCSQVSSLPSRTLDWPRVRSNPVMFPLSRSEPCIMEGPSLTPRL